MLFQSGSAFAGSRSAPTRGNTLADFESGEVTLVSYDPGQDQQPDAWELTDANTYDGSAWSLRLWGNTWKLQPIADYPISEETVLQVAAFAEEIGEMQALGVTDGTNTLFYTLAGEQLPTGDDWVVAYQGAFPKSLWSLYLLPIGHDWQFRYGYLPTITGLVYVNDRDDTPDGVTLFDAIVDVTDDLPVHPEVEIVRGRQKTTALSSRLYRVGIQFHAQVFDPDSDTFTFSWDFGDSSFSADPDPYHEFLVEADYTYTVSLAVRDESGLWGRDSAQVRVEPGEEGPPITMNFVGDVMLARRYELPGGPIYEDGPEAVFEPTRAIYGDAAEINVCNLESPLTDEGEPHPTKSYVFRGRPENVAGLVYAGIDVVSIGNNHIIDYGQRGMEETQEVLDAAGIRWSGAGDNDDFARQPVLWTERGVAVAFVGQCNRTGREWNYQPFLDAAYNKPGFSYLIEPNLTEAIALARPLADLVVIQAHAGIEYTTDPGTFVPGWDGTDGSGPTTAMEPPRDTASDGPGPAGTAEPPHDAAAPDPAWPDFRFPTRPSLTDRELKWRAVEAGADLVIGHHPHVLQGFEVYQGVLICHSLGNFAFDQGYAETFPTVIVQSEFEKGGFRAFWFRPVFIDDMIPRPATGRLGREILDRMADYSRELGTVVSVDVDAMQGAIHLDPDGIAWSPVEVTRQVPLVERDGQWISPPVERSGTGVLSAVLSIDAPGEVSWRIGREVLWHGDFEDEGATLWNLNSPDEVYDESVYHQGQRSLRQHRTPDNQGPVRTDLEGYPVAGGGTEFSLCGWIRTENARDARIGARLYAGRGSGLQGALEAGTPISGTQDWTWLWSDTSVPEPVWFIACRPEMERPDQGDGWAWYDEVRLVEWEPWRTGPLPEEVDFPNNLRFLQLRCTEGADSASVTWEELSLDPLVSVPEDPTGGSDRGDRLVLGRPSPNPFRITTQIEYSLPRPARVRLEIFDVSGRRVALLDDGARPAGTYRVDWSAGGAAAGLYFARLEVDGETRTRKLVRLR